MVEIAICLAIIGFALVAIIGVLPIGMNTQRDNREETIINQDATVFIEAIRNGAQGLDDLTNYVYAITNYWTIYTPGGKVIRSGVNGYNHDSFSITPGYYTPFGFPINNGTNIIGLLSMPEYLDRNGFLSITTNVLTADSYYSNHVVAYVRSLSGPAVEKPPQDNVLLRGDANNPGDSFGYRILCVNAPVAVDTNVFNPPATDPVYNYAKQKNANLHELRLTFLWPQLPNGSVGPSRQTFRTQVAGQVMTIVVGGAGGHNLYFYQPQSFINVINAP
jgi:type II secretory pathway pseudopilin PulG